MSRASCAAYWSYQIPSRYKGEPTLSRPKTLKSLYLSPLSQNSSSYFLGDAKNDTFQRVYGMSFPDGKQMTEYKKYLEEAAKRDHRRIGKDQELWMFSELSPGAHSSCPWV